MGPKHRLATVAAAVVVVVTHVAAQAPPPPTISTAEAVRGLADALDACKSGGAATSHPLMRTFVVEHTIAGEKNGACLYSQTMPGKMRMECAFSASGRKAMAAEIRVLADGGPIGGGTSRATPEWTKECEIVTASGARSPMAPASGQK